MICITVTITCTYTSASLFRATSTDPKLRSLTIVKGATPGGVYDDADLTAVCVVSSTVYGQICSACPSVGSSTQITICYQEQPTPHHPIVSVSLPAQVFAAFRLSPAHRLPQGCDENCGDDVHTPTVVHVPAASPADPAIHIHIHNHGMGGGCCCGSDECDE